MPAHVLGKLLLPEHLVGPQHVPALLAVDQVTSQPTLSDSGGRIGSPTHISDTRVLTPCTEHPRDRIGIVARRNLVRTIARDDSLIAGDVGERLGARSGAC